MQTMKIMPQSISINEYNKVRPVRDELRDKKLVDSILANGLVNPITVYQDQDGVLQLAKGLRRLEAWIKAYPGEPIDCIVALAEQVEIYKYIFFFEDGYCRQSSVPPTTHDIDSCLEHSSVLEILRIDSQGNVEILEGVNEYNPLKESLIKKDDYTGEYHSCYDAAESDESPDEEG